MADRSGRCGRRHAAWAMVGAILGLVAARQLVGLAVSVALFWDRIVAMGLSLRP